MEDELKEAEEMGIKELQHELAFKIAQTKGSMYHADLALNNACTPTQWMDALVLRAKMAWALGERYNLDDLRVMARRGDLNPNAWNLLGMDYLHSKSYAESLKCLKAASNSGWLVAILSVICEQSPPNLQDEDAIAWLEDWKQCHFAKVISNPNIPTELLAEVKRATLAMYLRPVIRVPWSLVQCETGIEDVSLLPSWTQLKDGIIYNKL